MLHIWMEFHSSFHISKYINDNVSPYNLQLEAHDTGPSFWEDLKLETLGRKSLVPAHFIHL